MPFADEATDFTRDLVDTKIVRIKLLRRDQYNRAVAKVTTKGFLPFTKKDVTLQLAERGLATLYTAGGAEYDVSIVNLVLFLTRASRCSLVLFVCTVDSLTIHKNNRTRES